jgi:hypothetical protein
MLWESLRTKCQGEYLDLRERKEQDNGENCMFKEIIIFTFCQISLGLSNEGYVTCLGKMRSAIKSFVRDTTWESHA